MILNSTLSQDTTNPNILRANPVSLIGKEAITSFFTDIGHSPAQSLIYQGNNTRESWYIFSIADKVGEICTAMWLEDFKSYTAENSERTKELLEQMYLENPNFVDLSKPIQEWGWKDIDQRSNIVTSVQIAISFILQRSIQQQTKTFTQTYCLWLSQCLDIHGGIMWVDFEKRLYRHRELNNFVASVIKVWDRNDLYEAYVKLFDEDFPEWKEYYKQR